MMSIFQSPKANRPTSNKPVAKSVYAFDEQSGFKWVPLNKSFISLTKVILKAAVARMDVSNIAVTFRCVTHQGYRHLLLTGDEADETTSGFGAAEEFIISTEDSLTPVHDRFSHLNSVSVSMDFQGQRLGYLLAALPTAELVEVAGHSSPRVIEAALHQLASELASVISRYQTRYRAIFIYGDQNYWIGNSRVLHDVDQQLERLKDITKPVLIRSNKGTGKSIAARSLHCIRHQSILPFIESSCNEWQEGAADSILPALYSYAKGGTLYLRNVDTLSGKNLEILQRFWEQVKHDYAIYGALNSVGMIFSVSRKYYTSAYELSDWLEKYTVELLLPDLAERREDMRDLVNFFIKEYTLSVEFDFTEHAWRLLEAFNWRDNVAQLKRVIQKVALVAEEPLVTVSLLEPLLRD